jgi:hypothetical protein
MVNSAALLLLACATLPAYQLIPPAPKGSIAGVVTNAKTSAPLKKATVQLYMTKPIGHAVKTVDTDDQGRFLFPALDAGRYVISAQRQGFLNRIYGARKVGGLGVSVLLPEGQDVKDLTLRMMPQSVIVGKVLDEDGEPVAKSAVEAERFVYRDGAHRWFPVARTLTNDVGEFRLSELQPGRYIVSGARLGAVPAGTFGTEEAYVTTYYPSTPHPTTAVPIDVAAGDEIRDIDVRLVKTKIYRVRGKVVGYDGKDKLSVFLVPRDGTPPNSTLGLSPSGIASGPSFEFEIGNVPPGQYLAIAQVHEGTPFARVAQPVDVTGATVDGVVLTLEPGATVRGVVHFAESTAPRNLKNVAVQVVAPFGSAANPQSTAQVGDDFKFTLPNVLPVRNVVALNGLPAGCYVKSTTYGAAGVPAEGVEMTGGGTLDITLACDASQLDVVVLNEGEEVGWHAVVALVPDDGGPVTVATADDNGMLTLRNLKPGDYRLFAWADTEDGAPLDPDFRKSFESQAKPLKIGPSAHQAVTLVAIPTPQ